MALSTSVMLRRALRRRCPVCGTGGLFRHWLFMVDDCPVCGLRFRREPGQWLGSWFLNICVAQMAVALVLIIGVAVTYPTTPMWTVGGIDLVAALAVPVGFFPYSRTLWTAIDLAMRPLEFGEGVAPGFELSPERPTTGHRGRRRPR